MSMFEQLVEAGKRQFRMKVWRDGSHQGSIELTPQMQTDEALGTLLNPADPKSFISWARKYDLGGEVYVRV